RALDAEAEMLRRLARDDHHAAAGRFTAAQRSAELGRFAGDHRRRRMADVHAVGVHHPRHHLLVRVDVGRRDVLLGTDGVDDLGDVAAGGAVELLEHGAKDGAGGRHRQTAKPSVRVLSKSRTRLTVHRAGRINASFPTIVGSRLARVAGKECRMARRLVVVAVVAVSLAWSGARTIAQQSGTSKSASAAPAKQAAPAAAPDLSKMPLVNVTMVQIKPDLVAEWQEFQKSE